MRTVYLETTIPSYLAAPISSDLVVAANQRVTHTWWQDDRTYFDLRTSSFVMDENNKGEPEMARKRLDIMLDVNILEFSDDVLWLLDEYDDRLGLSGSARADLPHFAFAVAFNIDFLLTWNCAHIANAIVVQRLRRVNAELGRLTPEVVTPPELTASFPEE